MDLVRLTNGFRCRRYMVLGLVCEQVSTCIHRWFRRYVPTFTVRKILLTIIATTELLNSVKIAT